MSASINLSNEDQKNKLDNLLAKFPQEEMQGFFKSTIEDMAAELSKSSIEFKDDLLPAFGENFRILFAMQAPQNIDAENKKTSCSITPICFLNSSKLYLIILIPSIKI